jgi:hypothetical protein
MNKTIFKIAALFLFMAFISSCDKNDDGVPVEQELITTIKLTLTNTANAADTRTYTYKVENGFSSNTPGIVIADTLQLAAGAAYSTGIQVLNEKVSPVEDITTEILEEQLRHLFLFVSTPASGAGSVGFNNGNKDTGGKPFNQTGILEAGSAGSGTLTLYLIHEPTNKSGTTPNEAGGETDAAATYPIRIQ